MLFDKWFYLGTKWRRAVQRCRESMIGGRREIFHPRPMAGELRLGAWDEELFMYSLCQGLGLLPGQLFYITGGILNRSVECPTSCTAINGVDSIAV